jgi:hypothetical protein
VLSVERGHLDVHLEFGVLKRAAQRVANHEVNVAARPNYFIDSLDKSVCKYIPQK